MSRITRALLALALLALARAGQRQRGADARAGGRLRLAGRRRLAAARPDAGCSWSSAAGACGSSATARKVRRRLPRHRRPGRDRRRARAAVDRLRARLRGLRALLRLPDRRASRAASCRCASTAARRTTPTAPSRPAGSSGARRTPRRATTTAARSRSGRTGCCGSRPATAAAATISSTTRATARATSASCCGSIRTPATAAATRSPPTTRSAPRSGRYGLRNPFRFSFDVRGTGDLLIGDVGEGKREEIDWAPYSEGLGRGADYGWSCLEGTLAGAAGLQPGPELPGADLGVRRSSRRAR